MIARAGALAAAGLLAASLAAAAPPFPIPETGAPFPGGALEPYSARTAGGALADYWLGEEPAGNPAGAAGEERLSVSPLFLRSSRQDLRALYREYDEQTGYFDVGAAELRQRVAAVPVAVYMHHTVLREESQAYRLGDITGPSASRAVEFSARERRLGLAVALPARWSGERLAVGIAAEHVWREDHYELTEESGSPNAGRSFVDFDGESWGMQLGVRWDALPDAAAPSRPRVRVGVAWRRTGEFEFSGKGTSPFVTQPGEVDARRPSVDELGAGARVALTPAVALTAGAGWRGGEDYPWLQASAGSGDLWALALRYHDPRDPWAVWLGAGEEQRDGTPEPRAGLLGLGLGWTAGATTLEVGVLRRTIPSDVEAEGPSWYDYRLLASAAYAF